MPILAGMGGAAGAGAAGAGAAGAGAGLMSAAPMMAPMAAASPFGGAAGGAAGGAPMMSPMPVQKPPMIDRFGNSSYWGAMMSNHGDAIGKGIGQIGGALNPEDKGGPPQMQQGQLDPQVIQMAMQLMKAGRIGMNGQPVAGGQAMPRTPPALGAMPVPPGLMQGMRGY